MLGFLNSCRKKLTKQVGFGSVSTVSKSLQNMSKKSSLLSVGLQLLNKGLYHPWKIKKRLKSLSCMVAIVLSFSNKDAPDLDT